MISYSFDKQIEEQRLQDSGLFYDCSDDDEPRTYNGREREYRMLRQLLGHYTGHSKRYHTGEIGIFLESEDHQELEFIGETIIRWAEAQDNWHYGSYSVEGQKSLRLHLYDVDDIGYNFHPFVVDDSRFHPYQRFSKNDAHDLAESLRHDRIFIRVTPDSDGGVKVYMEAIGCIPLKPHKLVKWAHKRLERFLRHRWHFRPDLDVYKNTLVIHMAPPDYVSFDSTKEMRTRYAYPQGDPQDTFGSHPFIKLEKKGG